MDILSIIQVKIKIFVYRYAKVWCTKKINVRYTGKSWFRAPASQYVPYTGLPALRQQLYWNRLHLKIKYILLEEKEKVWGMLKGYIPRSSV